MQTDAQYLLLVVPFVQRRIEIQAFVTLQADELGVFQLSEYVGYFCFTNSGLAFIFPEKGRLSAILTTTARSEYMLYRQQPFHSGFALPDYYVWAGRFSRVAGFFDAKWKYDRSLSR